MTGTELCHKKHETDFQYISPHFTNIFRWVSKKCGHLRSRHRVRYIHTRLYFKPVRGGSLGRWICAAGVKVRGSQVKSAWPRFVARSIYTAQVEIRASRQDAARPLCAHEEWVCDVSLLRCRTSSVCNVKNQKCVGVVKVGDIIAKSTSWARCDKPPTSNFFFLQN